MPAARAIARALVFAVTLAGRIEAQQAAPLKGLPASSASIGANDPLATAQQPAPAALRAIQQMEQRADFAAARQHATAYLLTHDDSAAAHELLAYALLRLNEPRQALEQFQRAVEIEPPSAALLLHVGQAYVLLGDDADADKWTLRAVETDPANADAWYGLGRLRYSEQRFPDARRCFEQVLKLSPLAAKAEDNLGLTLEAMNDSDAAESAYRRALALEEKPAVERSEQPYLNLGTLMLHEGKTDEARALLEKAAVLAPNDARVQEQIGQLALRSTQWASAEQAFSRAVALDPANAALHFLRGQALKHEGREAEAAAEFARSASLHSESTVAPTH